MSSRQSAPRRSGGIVETALQTNRNRQFTARKAELEQTSHKKKSGRRCSRSRIEFWHGTASDDGILSASICRVLALRANNRAAGSTLQNLFSTLDIGTGSGILAIAAAKLGCKPVYAIDFDPEAVRVARANARVNGVLKKIKIAGGDVTEFSKKPKEQFDLVCANLISNLLIAERKKIFGNLKPGGVLVLSGILKLEFSEVQKAFESLGLKLISGRSKKEWRSGCFVSPR